MEFIVQERFKWKILLELSMTELSYTDREKIYEKLCEKVELDRILISFSKFIIQNALSCRS